MDRRTFLRTAAGGVALGHLQHQHAGVRHFIKKTIPGRPARTPIKHIVILMMENRSVDHYLGWYGRENPNFDARQAITVPDLRAGGAGKFVTGENWGYNGRWDFHGRGFDGPSHSWDGGRIELAGGRVDGWLDPKAGNDEFCLSYYDAADVPVSAQFTRNYQSYDRWFCSLLGPTEPNRYYMHSGQAGGMKNNDTPPQVAADHPRYKTGWDWATIWDLFDRFHMSGLNYFCNLPELAYWGPRHVNRMRHIAHYFEACETGTLPQVSVIAPFYQADGFGNDDHPHSDIRLGQAFISDVTEAFVNSRHYKQGALVVTYDEWGGFHDHVVPPRLADDRGTPNDPGGKDDFGQLGFRIPATIVSPWTRRGGSVDHSVYEHASMVRFIADNWNLPHLTTRVRATNSIERAFGGFRTFDPEPAFTPYTAPAYAWRKSGIGAMNQFINTTARDPFSVPVAGHIPGAPDWPLPPLPIPPNPIPDSPPKDRSGVEKLRDMGWMDKFKIRTDWKFEDAFLKSRPELLKATSPRRGT